MAKKLMSWKTRGMNRDLSVSAFNPEFSFENRNLRLGTNEGNTLMSWVNEKGTASISMRSTSSGATVNSLVGTPLGTAVLNHQLILFTHRTDTDAKPDYIYKLAYIEDDSDNTMSVTTLYNGNLGFSLDYPIETLSSYESETIQKVYWTDGKNQPRIINIVGSNIRENNDNQFDFVPTLKLQETVTVEKLLGANGMFAPGVIQYALTYYNKHGQESNVFHVSPLQYISFRDRGADPDDKVGNAFRITVKNVDQSFDYLRIYAIQRSSVNATPFCRRVQDIAISTLSSSGSSKNAVFTDTGTVGDTVTPTDLLYKGGEVINALTMNQKDNSLFLGNINIARPQISDILKSSIKSYTSVAQSTRTIQPTPVSTGSYIYANQLTSYKVNNGVKQAETVPCGGFKYGDTYRLGVQFQYKTGKWSDPIWIKDETVTNTPSISGKNVILPSFSGTIRINEAANLIANGYMKVRALVVFPSVQDRNILCQGVVNPTLYTYKQRYTDKNLYAQSSWFFRASNGRNVDTSDMSVSPADYDKLPYTHRGIGNDIPKKATGSSESKCYNYNPDDSTNNIRMVEVQGDFKDENKFQIDRSCVTFNSPDIEFDDQMVLTDYSNTKFRQIGHVLFTNTMSDIEIQTTTPTISNLGSGFVHKTFSKPNTHGIVSGLFYDDFVADDNGEIEAYTGEKSSAKWMTFLWHKTGALNNDINRPSNKGTQTATLKKKIISNLRYATTSYKSPSSERTYSEGYYPRIFSSEEVSIIKMGTDIYQGNIDTILMPDNADGDYFAYNDIRMDSEYYIETGFNSTTWWKTFSKDPNSQDDQGLYKRKSSEWERVDGAIGDDYLDLAIKKGPVRMKYKSTPHIVFGQIGGNIDWGGGSGTTYCLPIVEILQYPTTDSRFGGQTPDAFRANIWVPCGEAVPLKSTGNTTFAWEFGDTYYQRWDCLKTYAFTQEDLNQVIEIGSFMLETRVNIDGRYDKNRGQMNNLYMSPTNFNLLNPIYSQIDNFFQYKIQDDSFYTTVNYPNQLTWSLAKSSGDDIDAWTNMTMASVLELDGDKGEVTSLQRLGNNLICFQEGGISKILYNENFMLSTQEGVPIEIANSGKVGGKLYMNDKIGCANKWSVQPSTKGIYFMDSSGKDIYLYTDDGKLNNISATLGFNAWSKQNIPSSETKWTPLFSTKGGKSAFISYYDKKNQEMLFINGSTCLCYSEKYNVFTSFYDYHDTPYFCNMDDTGIWIKSDGKLWKHQAGKYCQFFGVAKPYSMTLVGNPEPHTDKMFTNLEFRSIVEGDGVLISGTGLDTFDESFDYTFHPENGGIMKFKFYMPFDSLEVWDEYQHGITYLSQKDGRGQMQHDLSDKTSHISRKFRLWRCDIPRNNYPLPTTEDEAEREKELGISRKIRKPHDRMRNPWLYLKLVKDPGNADSLPKTEIHDFIMTYFN